MEELARVERHRAERLAGVATDGSFFIFVRFRNAVWHIDDPLPLATHSTERFLRYLNALSTEKALTADNLVRDFGENQNIARLCVSSMYRSLSTTANPKVKVIFDQWRQQFSEVCGYEEDSPRLDVRKLARDYGIDEADPNAFRLFFSIHSYYATFIKLLAVQVVHYYVAPGLGTSLPQVANYPTDKLLAYLKDMERGGILKQLGVNNFLEGDFFGWHLEVWDDAMDRAIRRLVSELANYSLVTLDVDPEQTRDLLKKLYQNVMPKQLRHDLGEYYTPDWLAERLLNQLGFSANRDSKLHEKRLLDPACGSGTFLVLAIKRVKEHCAESMLPEAEVLERILGNIVGFDLNPLAVISARTNYLLALGDLLKAPRSYEVNIPVYLCDSILTPSQAENYVEVSDGQKQARMMGAEERQYKFRTVVGEFAVPGSLVSAQYVDQLAGLVEECVEAEYSVRDFRRRVLQMFPLIEEQDNVDLQVLDALYNRIKDLNERAINGIWARIIKNAFAPLFAGQFDYVAGNPPWVNWIHLPDGYRQQSAQLWEVYDLFPHTGLKARLGGACDDISVLMTYVCADRYLQASAKLGFVITQSVFKAHGGGEGFRSFMLPGSKSLRVLHVDDMSSLQPFEGASNRTSVVILQRDVPMQYPCAYTLWTKSQRGGIPQDAPLSLVVNRTSRANHVGQPIDSGKANGPWLTGRPRAVRAVQRVIGPSPYRARKGLETSCAGIYRLDVLRQLPSGDLLIANRSKDSRAPTESIQAAVEPDFVYPYIQGKDVQKWTSSSGSYILMPQQFDHPNKGCPELDMKAHYPKTYAFLHRFRSQLAARAVYRKLVGHTEPFYAMYNVGPYTVADYKVVWRYVTSTFTCTVVEPTEDPQLGMKPIIPDSKLVMVPFNTAEEAHFVSACLSSSPSRYLIDSYVVSLQVSTHVLHYVQIPKFNRRDPLHMELSMISQAGHRATSEDDEEQVAEIQQRLDDAAARLWGLSRGELRNVQDSLVDLFA